MKTLKEIEAVIGRLSLPDLEHLRVLVEDRIEDYLEVTPEAKRELERSHRELAAGQFARH